MAITQTHPVLVMKFGGTSVEDLSRIHRICGHVLRERRAGYAVVVVVSAIAGTTNTLIDLVQQCLSTSSSEVQRYLEQESSHLDHEATEHSAIPFPELNSTRQARLRESDLIVSTGETVSSGLLSLALQTYGQKAHSYQGWQVPILTDSTFGSARIKTIDVSRLRADLLNGIVPVVAGFQGIEESHGRVTTLGRGGSDTSAVALAVALEAKRCDIYTDVDGVYTTDPRYCSQARQLKQISYEEMLELASMGANVLHPRSVELATIHHLPLVVRSSFAPIEHSEGGTRIVNGQPMLEQNLITAITVCKNSAQIVLRNIENSTPILAKIFTYLAQEQIDVDMIIHSNAEHALKSDLAFTVPSSDYQRARDGLSLKFPELCQTIEGEPDLAKISAVGVGMRNHPGVAAIAFRALEKEGIAIRAITTSEIKLSLLIDPRHMQRAIESLHKAYKLHREVGLESIEAISATRTRNTERPTPTRKRARIGTSS